MSHPMPKQLDHAYFEWLVSQIEISGHRTYNDLFEKMHTIEFVWTVPNDDNRVQDGLDLRSEFLSGVHGDLVNPEVGVSLLEVLVALSRKVAFIAGGQPSFWAWQLLDNLGLRKMSDPLTGAKARRADDIFDALIWRTYRSDGRGGFFPLNWPDEDQTKVEIWYQMNKYVNEIQEL